MTEERARQLLREIWGHEKVITAEQSAEVENVRRDGETLLSALQRIAGDSYDWRKNGAFSREAVNHFASL